MGDYYIPNEQSIGLENCSVRFAKKKTSAFIGHYCYFLFKTFAV